MGAAVCMKRYCVRMLVGVSSGYTTVSGQCVPPVVRKLAPSTRKVARSQARALARAGLSGAHPGPVLGM